MIEKEIPLTPEQAKIVDGVVRAAKAAEAHMRSMQDRLGLVVSAVVGGHGVGAFKVRRFQKDSLVIEIAELAMSEEGASK